MILEIANSKTPVRPVLFEESIGSRSIAVARQQAGQVPTVAAAIANLVRSSVPPREPRDRPESALPSALADSDHEIVGMDLH